MNSFRFLARADPLQPLIDGRPRGDALELAAQEPLHRLAPPRGAQSETIPYFFRNAPYGDLHCHDCIVPLSPADGNGTGSGAARGGSNWRPSSRRAGWPRRSMVGATSNGGDRRAPGSELARFR